MDLAAEGKGVFRGPARSGRSGYKPHPRLLRRITSLRFVAWQAAANDILPGGLAAPGPGNHMVQIQFAAWEGATAILAGIAVTDEDIPAAEPDCAPWNTVVGNENQHPRNSYRAPDKPNAPTPFGSGQNAPGRIVEQFILFVDSLGKSGVKKAKSAAHRGYVNREESAIQNKNAGVQHCRNPRRVMLLTLPVTPGAVNHL